MPSGAGSGSLPPVAAPLDKVMGEPFLRHAQVAVHQALCCRDELGEERQVIHVPGTDLSGPPPARPAGACAHRAPEGTRRSLVKDIAAIRGWSRR